MTNSDELLPLASYLFNFIRSMPRMKKIKVSKAAALTLLEVFSPWMTSKHLKAPEIVVGKKDLSSLP